MRRACRTEAPALREVESPWGVWGGWCQWGLTGNGTAKGGEFNEQQRDRDRGGEG